MKPDAVLQVNSFFWFNNIFMAFGQLLLYKETCGRPAGPRHTIEDLGRGWLQVDIGILRGGGFIETADHSVGARDTKDANGSKHRQKAVDLSGRTPYDHSLWR